MNAFRNTKQNDYRFPTAYNIDGEMNTNPNQIDRVIFQARFPAMLEIDRRIDEFQGLLRGRYPNYQRTQPVPSGLGITAIPAISDHILFTDDGIWTVTLSVDSVSLTCSKYKDWSEFKTNLDQVIDAFRELFDVKRSNRIGLRYINAIRPSALGLKKPQDAVNEKYRNAMETNLESPVNVNMTLSYELTDDIRGRTVLTEIMFNDGEKGLLIDDDVFIEVQRPIERMNDITDELNRLSLEVFKKMASEELQKKVIL